MPNPNERGFILLYVVGLIASISVILLKVGQIQSPSTLFMERQMTHDMQRREAELLLDFVIAGTADQKLKIDPRFSQFKRILRANPNANSNMDEQIAWLKAALGQMGFNIDIKPRTTASSGRGGESTRADNALNNVGILFHAQKKNYDLKLGENGYAIRILPGNALPNLNAIPFEALTRYLKHLKIPENEAKPLAAALIDWRDADNFNTEGLGAESEYYSALKPAYSARNGPVRSWQELNFVRGMTPQRVRLLRSNFMLGSPTAAGLVMDYASTDVLTAVTGLKSETVISILNAYRKLDDKHTNVSDILLGQDAAMFEKNISWQADMSLLRIEVISSDNVSTVDYDVLNKRIIGSW